MSLSETLDRLHVEVVAYVDPHAITPLTFRDKPVFASAQDEWWADGCEFTIAIGDNTARQQVADRILVQAPAHLYATLVHPDASVAKSARLESGVMVLQGGIVGADACIGTGALVNSGSIVEHECELGEYASLGPGAVIGGRTCVGRRSAISIGATLKHGISVGDDTVVGAGSYVHGDLPDGVVAYGIPAVVRRSRKPTDPYLV